MQPETAILLVNIGTPGSPKTKDVRRYLGEFLGDKRVIPLPWLLRKLLVNLVIVPFRAPKSAKLYQSIWTSEGSPLLVNGIKLKTALKAELGDRHAVFLAMRYGFPNLKDVIDEIAQERFRQVILVPLFPQYAESTAGSVIAYFRKQQKRLKYNPEVKIASPFFNDTGFIEAFRQKIENCKPADYDHVIFSFHGLPVKQTEKMHPGLTCEQAGCMEAYTTVNAACYRASCYETTRLLAKSLNLPGDRYTVTFQSRFGKNWLQPFTDAVVEEKARQGIKSVLMVSPSFVADCLETLHELGSLYSRQFLASGGTKFQLVESLNADEVWVKSLAAIIQK